jgi:hypothetical protein
MSNGQYKHIHIGKAMGRISLFFMLKHQIVHLFLSSSTFFPPIPPSLFRMKMSLNSSLFEGKGKKGKKEKNNAE